MIWRTLALVSSDSRAMLSAVVTITRMVQPLGICSTIDAKSPRQLGQ